MRAGLSKVSEALYYKYVRPAASSSGQLGKAGKRIKQQPNHWQSMGGYGMNHAAKWVSEGPKKQFEVS